MSLWSGQRQLPHVIRDVLALVQKAWEFASMTSNIMLIGLLVVKDPGILEVDPHKGLKFRVSWPLLQLFIIECASCNC